MKFLYLENLIFKQAQTNMIMNKDQYYMSLALLQANIASKKNEVPVGAVIVGPDGIISSAYNQVESCFKPFAHAELLAIEKACGIKKTKYLEECTLYVTLEPCALCMNGILISRLKRVCFGARSGKWGFNIDPLLSFEVYKTSLVISEGIFSIESAKLLKDFFNNRRG